MDSKKSNTQKQPMTKARAMMLAYQNAKPTQEEMQTTQQAMNSNKKAKLIIMSRYRLKKTPQPSLSTMLKDGTVITHHK